MSVREIRRILKECIDNEDKKKPYTDDELTDILKEKGYPIARRTVAKYRQQLNIPVARLRTVSYTHLCPYPVVSAKVNNRSEGLNFRVYNNKDV